MIRLKIQILFILSILCCNSLVSAAVYYVSPAGNDKNPGTIDLPWRTITKANQELQPGDTVYLRHGRYQQTIIPLRSGRENAYITYSGYGNEIAVIHSRPTGANLSGKSYISIQKLHFENCNYFIRSYPDGFDFCIIKECVMTKQTGWCGIEIGDGSSFNKILNNFVDSAGIEGDCIHIGSDDFGEKSGAHHNLVADNECFAAMHGGICCAGDKTTFNIIRNNYIHDIGDNAIATGAFARWTIIEGNKIYNPGTDRDGASAMQIRSENNIIRYNLMYRDVNQDIDNGAAALFLQSTDDLPYVRNNYIYHNVIYHFDQQNSHWHGIQLAALNTDVQFGPNFFKNNIIYKNGISHKNGFQIAYTRVVSSIPIDVFDGNLICAEKPGDPVIYFFEFERQESTLLQSSEQYPSLFLAHNINASPLFIDEEKYDFRLHLDSPCIDSGVFLTSTTSSGSGTRIAVKDASYFSDGWGIVTGDVIKFNSGKTASIINIDYASNMITIDKELSWQKDERVSLYFNGKAPDIGAHESDVARDGDALAPIPPQNVRVIFP